MAYLDTEGLRHYHGIISSEFDKTNDSIDDLAGSVESEIRCDEDGFAQGALSSTTAGSASSTYTIRSYIEPIDASLVRIEANEGYRFLVFCYIPTNSGVNYQGWWNGEEPVKTGGAADAYVTSLDMKPLLDKGITAIRITVRKTNNPDIGPDVARNIKKIIRCPKMATDALEKDKPIGGFVVGKYIPTGNAAVGGTVNLSGFVESEGVNCAIVPCVKGERFHLTGKCFVAPRLWAFVDTSSKLLELAALDTNNETICDHTLLTAPEDGCLIVNVSNKIDYDLGRVTTAKDTGYDAARFADFYRKRESVSKVSYVVRAQREVAEDWHIPFIDVSTAMGLGKNHLIPGTKNTWSQTATKALNQAEFWMEDGTHPHLGIGVKNMYARTVANAIRLISPIYYPDPSTSYDSSQTNPWNGKRAVWFGTSVPAGSDPRTRPGNGLTYPEMVAAELGMTVSNKAKGSSCVRINSSTGDFRNMKYDHFIRSLTRTVDECDAIAADWSARIDNGTWEETYGNLVGVPRNETTGAAIALPSADLETMKEHSFENLLVPYLDGTYTEPDLFVLDHGHNDRRPFGIDGKNDMWIDPTYDNVQSGLIAADTYMTASATGSIYTNLFSALNVSNLDDIGDGPARRKFAATLNRNTFKGAMNFLITVILRYKPHARIVIIGTYL